MNYDDFISNKTKRALSHGFDPLPIKAPLFDWQKYIVEWAIRKGRAALFEDCGLGKIGSELKESYFKQSCQNLANARSQIDLFA